MPTPHFSLRQRWLAPLLLGAVGLWLAFYPTLSSGFASVQADPADTRHLNYVLEHDYRWLSGQGAELWSPHFFYPVQNVSAYTELLLGLLPFYAPLRALGLEPDTAFQGWMVLMGALNFAAALLLFRRGFAFDPTPAAFGAFLVAFGSPRLCQLNHQHLLPHFFTLLAVYALARLFSGTTAATRHVALFAAALVAQCYAGIYLTWFFGFCLGLALVFALALPSLRALTVPVLRANAAALAVGALATVALCAPLLGPYLRAGHEVGFRSFAETAALLPRAQSWLYLGVDSVLYGWLATRSLQGTLPMEWEHRLGIGLLTTAVVIFTFWTQRARPLLKLMGLVSLTVMLTTLTYRGGWSPWRLVFDVVPGANALRAVSRIGLLLLIPAGVALASFLQTPRLTRRTQGLALAAAVFGVAEQAQWLNHYDKQQLRADVAAVTARVPRDCHAFFWSPRDTERPLEVTQLDAMWASLDSGVPTVNGYSSNFPRGWNLRDPNMRCEADVERLDQALADWRALHQLASADVCLIRP